MATLKELKANEIVRKNCEQLNSICVELSSLVKKTTDNVLNRNITRDAKKQYFSFISIACSIVRCNDRIAKKYDVNCTISATEFSEFINFFEC